MKIHEFAKQGNMEGIARELAAGIDIDAMQPGSEETALACLAAAPDASLAMLQFLVQHGARITPAMFRGVVQWGSIPALRFLLDAGTDLHFKEPGGCDFLTLAVYGRNAPKEDSLLPVLSFLIEQGIGVRDVSSYGESALKVAARTGRFDAVALLLKAGADASQLEWTELMHAVALGSVEEMRILLDSGADLEARDCWNRTPWLLSVQVGDVEKSKLLLAASSDRNVRGRCEKTPLMYAIEADCIEMIEWLIAEGFDVEAADEFGTTPLMLAAEQGSTWGVRILLQAGANPHKGGKGFLPIQQASNLQIVRLLVAAGEELSDISDEMRAALTGVGTDALQAEREQYLQDKNPKFGTANPQRMDVPFWQAMVRSGAIAYEAKCLFGDESSREEPVWCYKRFGRTSTELPDGRIVEIGGEHEDFYDPDFCIYNDVVVYDGKGNFEILGYPESVFPPTDFHTATLIGESIFIIGCLGYPSQRKADETPVYRLYCDSFKMVKVNTTGEKPGWISDHKARYEESGQIIITGGQIYAPEDKGALVANTATYVLDVTKFKWSRLPPK